MDALTNEPPGGSAVDVSAEDRLKRHLESLVPGLKRNQFPGAQPVSFQRSHLDQLKSEDYFVSEKSDGTRYLLFITNALQTPQQQESFLIDRKNRYHHVQLFFPQPTASLRHPHTDTLLDGELVIDHDPTTGRTTPRFLAFDLLMIAGQTLFDRPFTSRLGRLKEHVVTPYNQLASRQSQFGVAPPFTIEMKKVEKSYGLPLVQHSIQHLRHENDGFLFTSATAPYNFGTCETMLKWKPADQNSIDFKVRVVAAPDGRPRFELYVLRAQNDYEIFGELVPDTEEMWLGNPAAFDGKIAECRFDPQFPTRWRFMRFREDKDTPNHVSVARKIMESIREGVALKQLLDDTYLNDVRSQWKSREQAQKVVQRPANEQ